jgi:hypothetical protein
MIFALFSGFKDKGKMEKWVNGLMVKWLNGHKKPD